MSELLVLEGVTKAYGRDVVTEVLHGIDLTVDRGELVALVGPSGSGKSTLLNLIGLLDRPTTGSVRIDGRDTRALDERELTLLRGRTLGFVFQFHHLIGALSAVDNVTMPLAIAAGRIDDALREAGREILAQVGLAGRESARPGELSGGQQQRVAIARALIHRPPLVLADEPTGNLDTQTSEEVFALIRRFNRQHGVAFLVVTHDPSIARRCHRTVELVDGRIVQDTSD